MGLPVRRTSTLASFGPAETRHRPGRLAAWIAALAAAVCGGIAGLVASRPYEAAPFADALLPATATIGQGDLREALTFLASDERRGRGIGDAGNEAAVRYLETALARSGLSPAAGTEYRQPVPLVTSSLGPANQLEATSPGDREEGHAWTPGSDYYPLPGSPAGLVSGPVTYVGPSIAGDGAEPQKGSVLRDHVVLVLDTGRDGAGRRRRSNSPDASWLVSKADVVAEQARAAAERGALALGIVGRERRLRAFDTTWPESGSARGPSYHLDQRGLPIPVFRLGADAASHVLGLHGDRAAPSVSKLFEDPRRRLDTARRRVALRVDTLERPLTVHNVVARLEGHDPDDRNGVVVVGAHLDHDGVDAGGRVFNGADDDASGTAAVLEMAGAFAQASRDGHRPRRSVVVAFWNAEEKGLLGSRHYVAQLRDARRVVAMLNLDMVGRHEEVPDSSDPRFRGLPRRSARESKDVVHVLGYTFSPDLAGLAREEADQVGLSLKTAYDANPVNLLRRSDHWPFLVARIPALFVTTGLHPDYHTPQDDVDRIDFEKLERIARFAFRLAWRAADAELRPAFVAPEPEP